MLRRICDLYDAEGWAPVVAPELEFYLVARNTDPDVPFDCVPRVARELALTHAISNSFGFGGQNVTLLFRAAGA